MNDTAKRKTNVKRTDGEKKFNENLTQNLVKYRSMIEQKCGFSLDTARLTELLKDRNIKVTKSTVDAVFNDPQRAVPLDVLVGICDIWGINIADVIPCQERQKYSEKDYSSVWKHDNTKPNPHGFAPLPQRFYGGTYYCYFFRPTFLFERIQKGKSETETQPIYLAKLQLECNNGHTTALFEQLEVSANFERTGLMEPLILNGSANLLIDFNQVQIDLMDSRGIRGMSIMFPYIHLARDVLYSQVGAVFNISSEQYRHPVFQKMAIFRTKLDLRNSNVESVLRGILSMNSHQLLIEKGKFEKLCEEHPVISQFPHRKGEYFVLYEDSVYNELPMIDGLNFLQLTEYIMLLRNISSSPAILRVREHDRYPAFSKRFQQEASDNAQSRKQ